MSKYTWKSRSLLSPGNISPPWSCQRSRWTMVAIRCPRYPRTCAKCWPRLGLLSVQYTNLCFTAAFQNASKLHVNVPKKLKVYKEHHARNSAPLRHMSQQQPVERDDHLADAVFPILEAQKFQVRAFGTLNFGCAEFSLGPSSNESFSQTGLRVSPHIILVGNGWRYWNDNCATDNWHEKRAFCPVLGSWTRLGEHHTPSDNVLKHDQGRPLDFQHTEASWIVSRRAR